MSRALTRRFALEELAATPDGAGGQTHAWVEVATLAAELKALSGRERASGGRRRG